MIRLAAIVYVIFSLALSDLVSNALTITGQVGDTSTSTSTCWSELLLMTHSRFLSPRALMVFKSTLYQISSLALRSMLIG